MLSLILMDLQLIMKENVDQYTESG